jgi:hypothetical protein
MVHLFICHRFCLKLRVKDDTAMSTFVVFDRDATLLLKKSCVELIEASNLVTMCVVKQLGRIVRPIKMNL